MIYILIGPSASGKDTMMKRFVDNGMKPIVTYTTRPIREGEEDGVDYHFISKEKFFEMKRDNKFFESREYNTLVDGKPDIWYYGSTRITSVDLLLSDHVTIVDLDGASAYIETYGAGILKILYLKVPEDVRRERAIKRGSFDETEWDRRLIDDREKFSEANLEKINNKLGPNSNIIIVDNNDQKGGKLFPWLSR